MGTDHYSADEEAKRDPVIITDPYDYRGRTKGKKFDKFTLPSGAVVNVYYVTEDNSRRFYDGSTFKPFYAQTAGREFRADNPTLIKRAVIDYLNKATPAVLKEVIVIASSHADGETIRVFSYCFTRTWHGISGDGTPVTRNRFDKEQRYRGDPTDKMIPFTEERWARIKEAHVLEKQLDAQVWALRNEPADKIAEHLDTRPIFDLSMFTCDKENRKESPADWLK